MINIVSKKRFLILEKVIEKKEFTQYGLKKELGLGMSIVNDTVNTLTEKEFVKKEKNKYVLVDEKGLLELIAFLKPARKKREIQTSLKKEEAMARLPNVVFCMETALEQYANYYKSNRIACYATSETLKKIEKQFFSPGKTTEIAVFEEDIPLEKKEIHSKNNLNYTGPVRTIIDLYRDGKALLADKIIGKVK